MPVITSIADLRAIARKRVPRAIFDYADRGSYDEVTLRRNRADYEALQFRQRVAVDVSSQSLASTMAGQPVTMPLGIAPTGLTGLFHRNGEIEGCRAAQAFGVPFCLSTLSICSIEDLHAALGKPFWFQLYLMRDRSFNEELIARALAAKCSALVLTLDLQMQGFRRQDPKNGLSVPPRLTLRNALEIALRPRWALGVLFGKRRTFGNLAGRIAGSSALATLSEWIAAQFDPTVNWQAVEWVRSRWPGKLILKGILDPEDARLASASGADAIIVSNHGGRQLDGAPSTISSLPAVVEAVNGKCEVLLDGGVQCGQDVLKALALGARGCFMGKAFLYALAAGGGAGVTQALELMRSELAVTLGLAGLSDVRRVDRSILVDRR
ncbi:MAG: alpha-hydroxy acid oxidase [Steroidobacteraceae bacterium]